MKVSTIAFLAVAPVLAVAAASTSNIAVREAIETYNNMMKRDAEAFGKASIEAHLEKRRCNDPKSLCYPDGFSSCYGYCFNPASPAANIGCSISCSDICGKGGC